MLINICPPFLHWRYNFSNRKSDDCVLGGRPKPSFHCRANIDRGGRISLLIYLTRSWVSDPVRKDVTMTTPWTCPGPDTIKQELLNQTLLTELWWAGGSFILSHQTSRILTGNKDCNSNIIIQNLSVMWHFYGRHSNFQGQLPSAAQEEWITESNKSFSIRLSSSTVLMISH